MIVSYPVNLLANQPAGAEWLIQNLGPADIYVARREEDANATDGVKISAGEAISFEEPSRLFTRTAELWANVTAASADVRLLRMG
jgi:hypothetical protein